MECKEVEILLVEDNPNDVKLTLRALKKHNLANKVHVVTDGAEALDYIFAKNHYANRKIEETPKVILLDIKLPKLNGLEVLEKIKADKRTRSIPVVILTSSNQETDMVKSYKLGANSYITKPVEFDKFVNAVSKLGFYWLLLNETPQ
jgi:CheY-like chemotaxis protein